MTATVTSRVLTWNLDLAPSAVRLDVEPLEKSRRHARENRAQFHAGGRERGAAVSGCEGEYTDIRVQTTSNDEHSSDDMARFALGPSCRTFLARKRCASIDRFMLELQTTEIFSFLLLVRRRKNVGGRETNTV